MKKPSILARLYNHIFGSPLPSTSACINALSGQVIGKMFFLRHLRENVVSRKAATMRTTTARLLESSPYHQLFEVGILIDNMSRIYVAVEIAYNAITVKRHPTRDSLVIGSINTKMPWPAEVVWRHIDHRWGNKAPTDIEHFIGEIITSSDRIDQICQELIAEFIRRQCMCYHAMNGSNNTTQLFSTRVIDRMSTVRDVISHFIPIGMDFDIIVKGEKFIVVVYRRGDIFLKDACYSKPISKLKIDDTDTDDIDWTSPITAIVNELKHKENV